MRTLEEKRAYARRYLALHRDEINRKHRQIRKLAKATAIPTHMTKKTKYSHEICHLTPITSCPDKCRVWNYLGRCPILAPLDIYKDHDDKAGRTQKLLNEMAEDLKFKNGGIYE